MDSIHRAKQSLTNLRFNFGSDLEEAAAGDEDDLVNFKAKVDRTLGKVLSDLEATNGGRAKDWIEAAVGLLNDTPGADNRTAGKIRSAIELLDRATKSLSP